MHFKFLITTVDIGTIFFQFLLLYISHWLHLLVKTVYLKKGLNFISYK